MSMTDKEPAKEAAEKIERVVKMRPHSWPVNARAIILSCLTKAKEQNELEIKSLKCIEAAYNEAHQALSDLGVGEEGDGVAQRIAILAKEQNEEWESVAYWPAGTCGNHDVSVDTHDNREAALAVTRMLQRDGFGGGGTIFPTLTEIRPARSNKHDDQNEDTKRLDWLETQGQDEGDPFIERRWEIRGSICLNVRAAIDSAMNKKD